jgi:hypothetical protein
MRVGCLDCRSSGLVGGVHPCIRCDGRGSVADDGGEDPPRREPDAVPVSTFEAWAMMLAFGVGPEAAARALREGEAA